MTRMNMLWAPFIKVPWFAQRILPDISDVLNIPKEQSTDQSDDFVEDPALPADLWTPEGVSSEMPIGQILQSAPGA